MDLRDCYEEDRRDWKAHASRGKSRNIEEESQGQAGNQERGTGVGVRGLESSY